MDDWDERVDALWNEAEGLTDDELVRRMREIVSELPVDDARGQYELASVFDSVGLEDRAEAHYRRAFELGLDGDRAVQATIQCASTLRILDRTDEGERMLRELSEQHPDDEWSSPIAAFHALALVSLGREREGAALALTALARHLPMYSHSVSAYASEL
jgi:hypothetical protein